MYKYSVPLMLETLNRYGEERYIEKLKEIGAERVLLALDSYVTDEKMRERVFADVAKYCAIFKNAGFETGVWTWTFMVVGDTEYTHITAPNGAVACNQVCPSDENFCAFVKEYMTGLAKCKPDFIFFDDDFRYGMLEVGMGCTCKNHLAYMEKLVGEPLPREGLVEKLLVGGGNKYRSAWLRANGYYFERFAKLIRETVDLVDPTIRVGNCACMSTWDFDGISADKISKILAGNTKPFMRLIGAPYWAAIKAWNNRLQDTIELERMERSWCEESIEIFAEGDCFPRPRYTCPASYLEAFDEAIRVSGITDGILKYTFDYSSNADYENGYNRKHMKNRAVYKKIDELFADKTPCGVRVYEFMQKFENMDVPNYYKGSTDVQMTFFSPAARMLAACSVPTVYENTGVAGIAFGENAKYLNEHALSSGLILDIRAAEFLQKSGVDVGLLSVGGEYRAKEEYFQEEKEYVNTGETWVYDITVAESACVQSYFTDGEKKTLGSYVYENANGQSFLVFAFDGYHVAETAYRTYERQKQLFRAIERIGGKKLPATVYGCPDLYVLCKRNAEGLAVWAGNYHADDADGASFVLDGAYSEIEFINGTGVLQGDTVTLDKLPPFSSVGFVVKK